MDGQHTHGHGHGGDVAVLGTGLIVMAAITGAVAGFIVSIFWYLVAGFVVVVAAGLAAAVLMRRHYTRRAAAVAGVMAARVELPRWRFEPVSAAPPARQVIEHHQHIHLHLEGLSVAEAAAILAAHRNDGQH